jgi:transcription elongation factor Elf1
MFSMTKITFDCRKCGQPREALEIKISNKIEFLIEMTCGTCEKTTQVKSTKRSSQG